MAGVVSGSVIVGNGEVYKYVPVRDFIVEETEDVFYTKHPYKLIKETEKNFLARRLSRLDMSTEENYSRNFVENNDITRGIKVKRDNIPLLRSAERSQTQVAKDLMEYAKASENSKEVLKLFVHFKNLQTYTGDRISSSYFYSGGIELELLPNYGSSVCWGSHRISNNVAKETAHNEFLNMLFNYDISNRYREHYEPVKLQQILNVLKLFGYDNSSIEWLGKLVNDRDEEFTIFDMFLVASFFGICVDDYLKRKK